MSKWYIDLFKNYAEAYDKESYTAGTVGEVDFLEAEINSNKSSAIFDVGCGTGRHLLELKKRGYDNIFGFDLSTDQLLGAKRKAAANNLNLNLFCANAVKFKVKKKFDLVTMLCEGSFPLMETDELNFDILKNISEIVKPGGKFIFTTLNALFPIYHSTKEFIAENSGTAFLPVENNFDLMTLRDFTEFDVLKDDGSRQVLQSNERYYMPSEITWLLKSLGFEDICISGAPLGEFSKRPKLTNNDFEMLVVCKKRTE